MESVTSMKLWTSISNRNWKLLKQKIIQKFWWLKFLKMHFLWRHRKIGFFLIKQQKVFFNLAQQFHFFQNWYSSIGIKMKTWYCGIMVCKSYDKFWQFCQKLACVYHIEYCTTALNLFLQITIRGSSYFQYSHAIPKEYWIQSAWCCGWSFRTNVGK